MTNQVDLYRVVMGPLVWKMKHGQGLLYDVGFGNEYFADSGVKRNNIEQKNEISKANLEITIPIDHPLAVSLLTSYSEQVMTISVFTLRDASLEISWKGRLASIKPADDNLAMNFESVFTSLRRPGLRARFQRSCRHSLYARGCLVDRTSYAFACTIDAITGTTLTVPEAAAEADGHFNGGMAEALDGTLSYVVSHVGDQITLQRVSYSTLTDFDVFGAGVAVTLYPGCDHTRSTCNAKFGNILNYGGFDWIPLKNPLGGGSII